MIWVDSRVGSKDLAGPLAEMGLPVEVTTLEFADVAFSGQEGTPVGVELKVLGDLVGSLRSGRLAGHQLPGLRAAYEYAWLVVEGQWGTDARGVLTRRQGRRGAHRVLPGKMTAVEMEKQVLTLELCGGLHVRYTPTRVDTLRFLGALYRWWTDRKFDSHTSHLAVHTPTSFVALSPVRQVLTAFPGIGIKMSRAVETAFQGSLRRAVHASAQEWAEITTVDSQGHPRRFGEKRAQQLVTFLKGA